AAAGGSARGSFRLEQSPSGARHLRPAASTCAGQEGLAKACVLGASAATCALTNSSFVASGSALWIDQHAGMEQALRIDGVLCGSELGGEERRALVVVPGAVVAADGVVMGDRAAGLDQRTRGGALDRLPFLEQRAVPAQAVKAEIGRRPVGIDMGEAAGDLARPAGGIGDRSLGCRLDLVV